MNKKLVTQWREFLAADPSTHSDYRIEEMADNAQGVDWEGGPLEALVPGVAEEFRAISKRLGELYSTDRDRWQCTYDATRPLFKAGCDFGEALEALHEAREEEDVRAELDAMDKARGIWAVMETYAQDESVETASEDAPVMLAFDESFRLAIIDDGDGGALYALRTEGSGIHNTFIHGVGFEFCGEIHSTEESRIRANDPGDAERQAAVARALVEAEREQDELTASEDADLVQFGRDALRIILERGHAHAQPRRALYKSQACEGFYELATLARERGLHDRTED